MATGRAAACHHVSQLVIAPEAEEEQLFPPPNEVPMFFAILPFAAAAMLFGSSPFIAHACTRTPLARSLSSRRHAKCGPDLRSVLALEEFQLERSGAVTHKFASNYVVVVRVNEREYLHGRERELVGVEREGEREGRTKKANVVRQADHGVHHSSVRINNKERKAINGPLITMQLRQTQSSLHSDPSHHRREVGMLRFFAPGQVDR